MKTMILSSILILSLQAFAMSEEQLAECIMDNNEMTQMLGSSLFKVGNIES